MVSSWLLKLGARGSDPSFSGEASNVQSLGGKQSLRWPAAISVSE